MHISKVMPKGMDKKTHPSNLFFSYKLCGIDMGCLRFDTSKHKNEDISTRSLTFIKLSQVLSLAKLTCRKGIDLA